LYETDSPGSIAGEGAAMFLVNDQKKNAISKMEAIHILHSEDEGQVVNALQQFIKTNLQAGENIDLFLSGENGDNRTLNFYTACEKLLNENVPVARFKHMSGEYATASSFAVWMACYVLQQQTLPAHMMKRPFTGSPCKNILL
jgi:hypothetical protein